MWTNNMDCYSGRAKLKGLQVYQLKLTLDTQPKNTTREDAVIQIIALSLHVHKKPFKERTNPGQVIGLCADDDLKVWWVNAGLVDQQVVFSLYICKDKHNLKKLHILQFTPTQ